MSYDQESRRSNSGHRKGNEQHNSCGGRQEWRKSSEASIKSIYTKSILGLTTPRSHDKLNSMRKPEKEKSPTMNCKKIMFTYTLEGTSDKASIDLEYLDDMDNQDCEKWVSDFKRASCLCLWSEITQTAVLRTLLGSKYDNILSKGSNVLQHSTQ
ncbi:hypothetical protein DMUE_2911 [Dictyocoela muelleri]|nr:hypothetical protein DMUE_2911 [Dictyocoela muelleri]